MSPRLILPLMLLAAAPALAATPIDETRPVAADGRVSIDNLKGRIDVETWDRPEVRITGHLGEGVEKLQIDGSGGDLRIEVRYPQNKRGWFGWGSSDGGEPSDLRVQVPAGVSLDIDSVSATVNVTGVAGQRLDVDSVSGNVTVRAARPGEARLVTVSGDVEAELDTRELRAETVSGDLDLRGRIGGRVSLETVSGDLRLEAGSVGRLDFSSVSGDARLKLGLEKGGSVQADTVSGGLDLALPAGTSARLRVETFSGRIRSPVGKVETEEFGPGSSLRTRLGDGQGDIRLESFSGNVRIEID
ncbi:MAG TPA: DUF4097 family beta strand repeat-containing protein [Arenimonas sp.]|jgi:DUF4097 and DUF4098 domain-containing protein YvlB|nr:DUF4097 family beta strand repeat-containing protein [Arenimonas sp.]